MRTLGRRRFLSLAAALPALSSGQPSITRSDDAFLEDLSRRAFRFFWEQSNPHTGLVLDRVRTNGTTIAGRHLEVASIALTGFALTAMCIASDRRWIDPNEARERVRSTLRHLADNQEHVRGWYYHFVDRRSGDRAWNCELSTIDTALLIAGVLTAQQYYADDAEIFTLAANVYQRVDFPWILDPRTGLLHMGWFPETGFLRAEWANYVEEAILYLLGIASPTYPLPVRSWYLFDRQPIELCGYRYLGRGPLFTHQYSQAWLHLAGLRDGAPFQADYFQNSAVATYAHRAFCLSLRAIYSDYSDDLWGVSASDSEVGLCHLGRPSLQAPHGW